MFLEFSVVPIAPHLVLLQPQDTSESLWEKAGEGDTWAPWNIVEFYPARRTHLKE